MTSHPSCSFPHLGGRRSDFRWIIGRKGVVGYPKGRRHEFRSFTGTFRYLSSTMPQTHHNHQRKKGTRRNEEGQPKEINVVLGWPTTLLPLLRWHGPPSPVLHPSLVRLTFLPSAVEGLDLPLCRHTRRRRGRWLFNDWLRSVFESERLGKKKEGTSSLLPKTPQNSC